ncbi:hypothetical protein [Flavobacterium sp.]|uniref:hypothetical protein n=1 Tax=Flavobacterium sp. TaxID=239 RepID=UPI0035271E83
MKNLKSYFIKFVKDIIPVIIGILIALFINNWNEDRKEEKYVKQVFSTIKSELKDTSEELKYNIPLQLKLVDTLEYYSNDTNLSLLDITILKAKGIYLPQIKTNAWKSISNSKIDLIDYNQITTLSNISDQNEILKSKSNFLMNYIYSNFYEKDSTKKETLKIIILDIIQTEKTIQKLIEESEFNNSTNR